MRLDQAIAARFPHISRREARRLLAAHRILVNEKPVSAASRIVEESDRIKISEEAEVLQVLGADRDFIAVNKPGGLQTQPGRDRSAASLIERLAVQLKRLGESSELFVIHRLDAVTSGVVVFARSRKAAADLSREFALGKVDKRYSAVVAGTVTEELEINDPIGRVDSETFGVVNGGKEARSVITPVSRSASMSLVDVRIITGRTHQIRIHLAYRGHPIVGDRKYGTSEVARLASRPMLHARLLSHPRIGEVVAPPPEDFVALANQLSLKL